MFSFFGNEKYVLCLSSFLITIISLFFITSILLAILSGSNYKTSISQEIKTDTINEKNNPKVPTDN